VVFQAPYLDDEGLNTVVFASYDQSCEHNSMSCLHTERARPELGRLDVRGVDHELVSLHVQSRSCLQTSHVGPVTEFSLGIAADDVQQGCLLVVLLDLLFGSEMPDTLQEHSYVQCQGTVVRLQRERLDLMIFIDSHVVLEVLPVLVAQNVVEHAPPIFHEFSLRHFVHIVSESHTRIALECRMLLSHVSL